MMDDNIEIGSFEYAVQYFGLKDIDKTHDNIKKIKNDIVLNKFNLLHLYCKYYDFNYKFLYYLYFDEITKLTRFDKCLIKHGNILRKNKYNTIKTILECDIDIDDNTSDNNDANAFMYLCENTKYEGVYDLIKLFIQKKTNINAKNKYKMTPLIYICRNININSYKNIKLLLDNGANVNDITHPNKNTALKYVCEDSENINSYNIVNLLLDNGADINFINSKNLSPLMTAIYSSKNINSKNLIKLLLERGANINDEKKGIYTPLKYALKNINKFISIDIIKLLIEKGANVNLKLDLEWSPLMTICRYLKHKCSIDIIELLINEGADINYHCGGGYTPLSLASKYSQNIVSIDVIKLLLKNGADINYQNKYGNTALTLASKYLDDCSSIDVIKLLLENGADPDIKNLKNKTAHDYIPSKYKYIFNINKFTKFYTSSDCVICLENKPEYYMLSCGHSNCCIDCYDNPDNKEYKGKCSFCKTDDITLKGILINPNYKS